MPKLALTALRADAGPQDPLILRKGNRLSITPVQERHCLAIVKSSARRLIDLFAWLANLAGSRHTPRRNLCPI